MIFVAYNKLCNYGWHTTLYKKKLKSLCTNCPDLNLSASYDSNRLVHYSCNLIDERQFLDYGTYANRKDLK